MLERLYTKYLLSKMRKCIKMSLDCFHEYDDIYSTTFIYWNNKYWEYAKKLHKIKGLE